MQATTSIPCGHGRLLSVSPKRVEVEVISYKDPRYVHFELASDRDVRPTIVLWPDRNDTRHRFGKISHKTIWYRVLPEEDWQLVDDADVVLNQERIEFPLRIAAGQRVQISTEPPRPYGQTSQQLADMALQHPAYTRLHVIGSSIEQRPLFLLRVAQGPDLTCQPGQEQRPVIMLIAGEHATEFSGEEITRGMLDAVLADDPVGRWLREHYVFDVMLNANPDGNYHGWHQYNAADWPHHNYFDGVDRSWHHEFGPYLTDQAASVSPETKAICDWILTRRPALVFTAHSWLGHAGNLGSFRTDPGQAPDPIGPALSAMDQLASDVTLEHQIGYEAYNLSNLCSGHLPEHLVMHGMAIGYTVESHPYHSRATLQQIGRSLIDRWLRDSRVQQTIDQLREAVSVNR